MLLIYIKIYEINENILYWSKKDIVRSKILYLCKKISNRVHARKCIISITQDVEKEREFLQKHHIQGFAQYRQYSVSAYHNRNLIGVMLFAKHADGLELVRYATDINIICPGLFSKMLKYVIKTFSIVTPIISYSDNRISDGNLYSKSKWIFESNVAPVYCYTNDYVSRENKQNFMKSKLAKRFSLDENTISSKTEKQITYELGYDRLWDAGKIKWKYIDHL